MENRSKIGSKIETNLNILCKCSTGLQDGCKMAQRSSMMLQHSSKMAHFGTKLAQLAPNLAQLGINLLPSWFQNAAQREKRDAKKYKKQHLEHDTTRTCSREEFGTNFGRFWGSILVDFGSYFGGFLDKFWYLFCGFLTNVTSTLR